MSLEQNLAIIKQRWPDIHAQLIKQKNEPNIQCVSKGVQRALKVDGIHLNSLYDPEKEARQQASTLREDAAQVWLYGISNPVLAEQLLARTGIQQLHITFFSYRTFYHSLRHFDLTQLLADERLSLSYADGSQDVMFPFVANPACLRLAEEPGYKLRDQVMLELSTPYLNSFFKEKQQEHLKQIDENLHKLQGDKAASQLLMQFSPKKIAVIAAGPSLKESLPLLREKRDQYFVIAVLRVADKLRMEGIKPDIVIGIDPNRDAMYEITKAIQLDYFSDVPLVYFPIVHHDVLALWQGPRYISFGIEDYYRTLPNYDQHLKLESYGSVIHAALALAIRFKPDTIALYGADFSFPDNRSHIDNTFNVQEVTFNPAIHSYVLNGYGEKVVTTNALRGYLRDLERIIATHGHICYLNMSKQGAQIEGTTYAVEVA